MVVVVSRSDTAPSGAAASATATPASAGALTLAPLSTPPQATIAAVPAAVLSWKSALTAGRGAAEPDPTMAAGVHPAAAAAVAGGGGGGATRCLAQSAHHSS